MSVRDGLSIDALMLFVLKREFLDKLNSSAQGTRRKVDLMSTRKGSAIISWLLVMDSIQNFSVEPDSESGDNQHSFLRSVVLNLLFPGFVNLEESANATVLMGASRKIREKLKEVKTSIEGTIAYYFAPGRKVILLDSEPYRNSLLNRNLSTQDDDFNAPSPRWAIAWSAWMDYLVTSQDLLLAVYNHEFSITSFDPTAGGAVERMQKLTHSALGDLEEFYNVDIVGDIDFRRQYRELQRMNLIHSSYNVLQEKLKVYAEYSVSFEQ